ncbi:uncharacterized protein LTR77_003514 [Saxophila tyrrhenica]|uniref:Cell wall mannoprotein PIR1-like C-terminal domain-containing protein n=1 Tax=Saxophila tyrrhenica TaxID=1690608 RepID=A0AAV9PF73_9PEZI|nr:hypothetical protein LTR77_003514 [Saxophila tyrrhenica]
MKSTLAALTLAVGTQALVSREAGCCFGITAYGGPGGVVGTLGDGQLRIGGQEPAAHVCINNGGLTDDQGRGCILTPPTTQLQCDAGAAPTLGFEISCNGTISHNGESTFFSCPTEDNGVSKSSPLS